MNMKRIFILGLSLIMIISILFSGCSSSGKKNSKATTTTTTEPAKASGSVLPAKTEITYKYMINENPGFKMVNNGEIFEFFRNKTNVKIEFLPIPNASYKDKYNIILASNDLPDISQPIKAEIYGPKGVYLNLNKYMQYAPDFEKVVKDPKFAPYFKVSDGGIYHMPRVDGDESSRLQYAIIYRKDILDKLGLSEPDTYEGWYEVFKAVKQKYPDMIPYTIPKDDWRFRISAWGFSVEDGMQYDQNKDKWIYSPTEQNHKEAIEFHRKMYTEGLLDKEFLSTTKNDLDQKQYSGKTFAGISHNYMIGAAQMTQKMRDAGDKITTFTSAVPPKTNYAPRTIPTSPAVSNYGSDKVVAFSSKIKSPEIAIAFMNYIGYTKEGALTINYGIEGKHWTMESYGPDYSTEEQIKNILEGKTKVSDMGSSDRIPAYRAIETWFPENMKKFKAKSANNEIQKMSDELVKKAMPFEDKRITPPVMLFMTESELERKNELENILLTIYYEYRLKFITGKSPMTDWDKFIDQIKKNNVEELVKLYNDVQARYKKANQ